MKKIQYLMLSIAIIAITACSQDDILIENTATESIYILQKNPNTLEALVLPDNKFIDIELDTDIGKIDLIKKFRSKYYLLNQLQNKLFIIDVAAISSAIKQETNVINVKTIDFSAESLTPISICFPNATDAYIIYKDSDKVGILDLTNNTISKININISGQSSHIASAGNQVCVTCPGKGAVDIIDTRTNKVEQTINIPDNPTLVEFTTDGTQCIVITAGSNSSAPKLYVIDVESKQIDIERNLIDNADINKYLVPQACTITSNTLYVACKNTNEEQFGGFRIPISNYKTTHSMIKSNCNLVWYSKLFNTVCFLENNSNESNIVFFDAHNSLRIRSISTDIMPVSISD